MTVPRDPASTDRLTTDQKRDLLKALLEKRLRDTSPEFALSYGQRALWFLYELNPDMSAYNDPEVVWRMPKKHHAGLIVASPNPERVDELLNSYAERFGHDFMAVEPLPDKPWA